MVKGAYPTALVCFLLLAAMAAGMTARADSVDGDPAADGAVLFKAGRYEEALRLFEQAARQSPTSETAQRNLAHARAALGQELFLRGDFKRAGEFIDGALDILPEEYDFHLLRARIAFDDDRLYEARRHAEKALSLNAGGALAHEIAGDIHYQRGELSKALSSWRKAAGEGSERAEAKIFRTGRELDAEVRFGRDVSVHFTLQYDGPVSGDITQSVLDEMEKLYDDIGGFLGTYPDGDIPVILYSRILYHEVTRSPFWAAGSFDGKIRVPVAGIRNEDDVQKIRPVLAHELSHAFLKSISPRGLPLWFEEGLASHFEELFGRGIPPRPEPILSDSPADFASLDRSLMGGGADVGSAYRGALGVVRLVIDHSGDWSVRKMLEKVGRGVPFEQALTTETGLTLPRLESLWRRSRRTR